MRSSSWSRAVVVVALSCVDAASFGAPLATTSVLKNLSRALSMRILAQINGSTDTDVQHYAGTFYGVGASVDLDMNTRIANVRLSGAVLGGTLEGRGWLRDSGAEQGGVVLDPAFEARLKRRFVKVDAAALDRLAKTVTVKAKVPIFGSISLVLHQTDPK